MEFVEIIGTIFAALSPWFISEITDFTKRSANWIRYKLSTDGRKIVLRTLVVGLSILASIGRSALTGEPVGGEEVTEFVNLGLQLIEAAAYSATATGIYSLGKKKR